MKKVRKKKEMMIIIIIKTRDADTLTERKRELEATLHPPLNH